MARYMGRAAAAEYRDATGRRIRVGDVVRVLGVPDLSGMAAPDRRRSLRVFRYLVGSYRRVHELAPAGLLGLWVRIRRGPDAGLHWVALEPGLVRVRRHRNEHA